MTFVGTGIRNMIRRGVTEQVATKISGPKTVSVFRRYNITSDEDLHNAAALIEAAAHNLQMLYSQSRNFLK
jgi:hypothetical protein